jgi:enoyl-CoA hydratase
MALWATEISDGVTVATYHNPPMNYFCAEGARELLDLIERWHEPSVRTVVLTGGIPGKFITHYSVEELLALAGDRDNLRAIGNGISTGYHAMLQRLRDLPKAVIAAMNGDTMGGGFELSLACDIRIGARGDHRFGLPEVKLGILPGGSGTQRLARLLGIGRAIELILRGRVVDPETAYGIGLIHELADDALEGARSIARELAALPSLAIAQAKRAVYEGADADFAAGLRIESAAFFETMLSDDARRAMKRYVDLPFSQRRAWLERPDDKR